jgi:hypothetical protein
MSDGFWDREPHDGQDAETTDPGPLEALLTGGLPGFLEASLGRDDEEPLSEDEIVEDPEALRRAEEAVAGLDAAAPGPPLAGSDEPWVPAAAQTSPDGIVGLREVLEVLESEGVAAGWDPYDPVDAIRPVPGIERGYRILVPESSVARVRGLLPAVAPVGVRYAWPTGPAAAVAPPAEEGVASVSTVPATPITGVDRPLSDNELLAGLASSGRSGLAVAIAVFAVVVAVGVVVYVLLRG